MSLLSPLARLVPGSPVMAWRGALQMGLELTGQAPPATLYLSSSPDQPVLLPGDKLGIGTVADAYLVRARAAVTHVHGGTSRLVACAVAQCSATRIRADARAAVNHPVRALGKAGPPALGALLDVSLNGCLLSAPLVVLAGDPVRLTVAFEGATTEVDCTVRSVLPGCRYGLYVTTTTGTRRVLWESFVHAALLGQLHPL